MRSRNSKKPHCIQKYLPIYCQLHWSQTWSQLHICDLDRKVIDLNWQIAHGVLYTGACLAHSFGMRHIESLCFCQADDETLEHLFFECELARILVAWVYFNLNTINPTAGRFTVEELLFGFSESHRRAIPTIIIYMLLVVKHTIWVARCDFRFRQKTPIISECLNKVVVKNSFYRYYLNGARALLKYARSSESGLPVVLWGTWRARSLSSPSKCRPFINFPM